MVFLALCREQWEGLVEREDGVDFLAGAKRGCVNAGEDTWKVPGVPWGIL